MPLSSPTESRKVPASALRFEAACEFLPWDQREKPNRVPIRILARSGEAIEHPYWGKIVHDLAGMKPRKQRIQLDFCHWEWETVGYADGFDTSTGDLIVSGELVSTHETDQASIIIAKGHAGIPYEASIDFNGPGLRLEELGEGTTAVVNGRTVEGPAVIVREWPLRSVAICPYGADHNSQSEFSDNSGGDVAVAIFKNEEPKMHKKLAAALNAAIKKLTAGKANKLTKQQLTSQLAKAAGVTVKEMTAILAGNGAAVKSEAAVAKRLAAWAKVLKAPIASFKAAAAADEKAKQLADEENEQEGEDEEEKEQEDDEEMEDDEELEDDEEMEDDEELEDDEEMEDDEELEDDEEDKEQSGKSRKSQTLSAERKELQRFIKEFGPKHGARWFAAGKSFSQAMSLHAKRLKKLAQAKIAENKKLRRKFASLDTGESDPVRFNDGGDKGGSHGNQDLAQFERKLGSTGLARFAAGVKLPGHKPSRN